MNKTLRLLALILILGLGACALDEPSTNRGLAVVDGTFLSELDSDQTALSLIKGQNLIMYYTGARQGTNGLWRTENADDTLWKVPTYLAPADPEAGLAAIEYEGQEFVVYAGTDDTGLYILKFGNNPQAGSGRARSHRPQLG